MANPPGRKPRARAIEASASIMLEHAAWLHKMFPGRFRKEIAEMSPRDCMLTAMHIIAQEAMDATERAKQFGDPTHSDAVLARNEADLMWMRAAKLGIDAAPYVHVKLTTITTALRGDVGVLEDLTPEQRNQLVIALELHIAGLSADGDAGREPEGAPLQIEGRLH